MFIKKLRLVKKLIGRFALGNKNLILFSLGRTLKPKWIWFGVTDNCNSHCTHCNIWQKNHTQNQLTLKEIEKTLSDPLFDKVETIINSGGEAILRPDIIEIIKLEHKLFPKASLDLSTNGILADRALNVIKDILNENIKINIGVSLDAPDKKHDEIRGVPGNFEKVNYLLHELVKLREKYPKKLSIVIGLTLSDLTIDGWEQVKEYADKLNIDMMAQWYNQSSFYDNENKNNEINKDKMTDAVKKQPNTIIREKWLKLLKSQSIKFRCFAAQTFLVLRCDGNMVPCLSYWDLIMGNVREQSPSEIWHNNKAKEIRKTIAKCPGCLNSWGVEWSMTTAFYPRLFFYLRNPKAVLDRLKRRD